MSTSRAAARYSPLYILASVGAGGLSVTFFMYLLFWIPHPGRPVPIFEDIMAAYNAGRTDVKTAIVIAVFSFLNLKNLFWNFAQLKKIAKTEAYTKLVNSNGETQLLVIPLALAMSVNALFILGLVFVPGLWSVVEYLSPPRWSPSP